MNDAPNQIYSPYEDVAPEGTRYCYVLRPNEERSEFPQHSQCMIPEIDKDLDANGMWKIIAGIDGKTEEYVFEVNVDVKGMEIVYFGCKHFHVNDMHFDAVEKLDAGVDHDIDLNKIHLRCNLINSQKVMTFCRFLRLADDVGFNMDEGIGVNNYR